MRLIDADAFLWELTHWKGTDGNYHENSQTFYTLDEVMDAVEEADVEAEPVKRGEWFHYEGTITCSECKTAFYDDIMEYTGDDVPRYCPDCGAKMDGENE